MKHKTALLSLLILLIALASCNSEIKRAGVAGEAGMENVNYYIVPYVNYTLSPDHTYYIATIAKGAKLSEVSIPGAIYTQWGDMPVKVFNGFEDPSDAENLKTIYVGRYTDSNGVSTTVKVSDTALENATSFEKVVTDAPEDDVPRWGSLPAMTKDGYHFHGWYAGDEKIFEGLVITDSTLKATVIFCSLEHHEAESATCSETGNIEYWKCSDCQMIFSDSMAEHEIAEYVTPALGHRLKFIQGTPATCKGEGVKDHYICERCRKLFINGVEVSEADLVIPVSDHIYSTVWDHNSLGHWHVCTLCNTEIGNFGAHIWDDGTVTIAPLEHTKGEMTYECTVCSETRTEDIAELDHIWGVEEVKAPTCTEEGYIKSRCQNPDCLEEVKYEYTAALGHAMTHHQRVEPDCTNAGNVEYWHCSRCDKDFSDSNGANVLSSTVLSAKGHTWTSTYSSDASHHWHYCLVCNAMDTKTVHNYNREIATTEYLVQSATCQTGNTYHKSCICGKAGTETFINGNASSHKYEETKYSSVNQYYHQIVCDYGCGTAKPGSLEAHSFENTSNGKRCTKCGFTETTASGGFQVTVVDNTPKGHLSFVSHDGILWTYMFVDDRPTGDPSTTKLMWYVENQLKRTDESGGSTWGTVFTFEARYPMTYKLRCEYRNATGAGSQTVTVTGGNSNSN